MKTDLKFSANKKTHCSNTTSNFLQKKFDLWFKAQTNNISSVISVKTNKEKHRFTICILYFDIFVSQ